MGAGAGGELSQEPAPLEACASNGVNYHKRMIYVYVLLSEADEQFYTGMTSDLRRRFEEHNAGQVASTKHRLPFRLVYYEACVSRADAAAREKYLKTGMGKRYLKNRLKDFLGGLPR